MTALPQFGGQPTTLRNYKRVIETWWGEEYKEYFYTREPLAVRSQFLLTDACLCFWSALGLGGGLY